MNSHTVRQIVPGPAGAIECAIDAPAGAALGVAVICHPHPQHGGTMDNKVAQTLARAAVALGWRSVRFNFRGVGRSQGHGATLVGGVHGASGDHGYTLREDGRTSLVPAETVLRQWRLEEREVASKGAHRTWPFRSCR